MRCKGPVSNGVLRLRLIYQERIGNIEQDFRDWFGEDLSRACVIPAALRHGLNVKRANPD